jgi:hypothetical protein
MSAASKALPAGESKVFGLSNILMLLNGLLKYRHPDFTNQMLDEIERMIHGLDEHPFLIPTKIAAIRARRLSQAGSVDISAPTTSSSERGPVDTQKTKTTLNNLGI